MKKKSSEFVRKTVWLFVVLVAILSLVLTTYATANTKINEATKLADELSNPLVELFKINTLEKSAGNQ